MATNELHGWGSVSALLLTFMLSAVATAAREYHEQDFSVPVPTFGTTMPFARFDDHGGLRTLNKVTLLVEAVLDAGHVTVENDEDSPMPGFWISLEGLTTVEVGSLSTMVGFSDTYLTDGTMGASDGIPGSGPDFWDFGHIVASGSVTNSTTTMLDPFIGVGTIPVEIAALGGFTDSCGGFCFVTWTGGELSSYGTITIEYEYATVADLNDDGQVGTADLMMLLEAWGACPVPPPTCTADITGDGHVGFADLLSLLLVWSV